eukprot:5759935-Prymnesium_polylepis.1
MLPHTGARRASAHRGRHIRRKGPVGHAPLGAGPSCGRKRPRRRRRRPRSRKPASKRRSIVSGVGRREGDPVE